MLLHVYALCSGYQGCRFTKLIGRAHQLRPLADPADRLGGGGGILTG